MNTIYYKEQASRSTGKGQGSLEYLILITVSLVVAAVVVMFLSGSFGAQKSGVQYNTCRAAAQQCKTSLFADPTSSCDFCASACSDPSTNKPIFPNSVLCCRSGLASEIYENSTGTACTAASDTTVPEAVSSYCPTTPATNDVITFYANGTDLESGV